MAAYSVTALSTALEFDTTNASSVCVIKIPGLDRIAVIWYQSTTLVYVQCFNVNASTGAVTAIGSPLDIETGTATAVDGCAVVAIDASNLAVFWAGPAADGFVRLISMDGTGNCSTNGAAVEYDTANGTSPVAVLWDSTHILAWWIGTGGTSKAAIFVFNTGAGTISVVGTPVSVDTCAGWTSMAKLDATHAIVTYSGSGADGYAAILAVNNGTYAVTHVTSGGTFMFRGTFTINGTSVAMISSSPMTVIIGYGDAGGGQQTYIRSFSINTSTWAITAFGAETDVSGASTTADGQPYIVVVDSTHVLMFRQATSQNPYVYSLSFNTGTGDFSTLSSVTFGASPFRYSSAVTMSVDRYVCGWQGTDQDGFLQTFNVEQPAVGPTNLKSLDGNLKANIKSVNGNLIANVKSLSGNA